MFLPIATTTATTTTATATKTNMHQPRQYYINENQSCDEEDLDETNHAEIHLSKKIGNFWKLLNRITKIMTLLCS